MFSLVHIHDWATNKKHITSFFKDPLPRYQDESCRQRALFVRSLQSSETMVCMYINTMARLATEDENDVGASRVSDQAP